MSTDKKQNRTLDEQLGAMLASAAAEQAGEHGDAGSGYDTSGLKSSAEVQNALTNAKYKPSQDVNDAKAQLEAWQNKRPAAYQSAYQSQIDDRLAQLLGRSSFQYSYAQDPLYRQYAQAYTQNARNASADAAAQAAALTGGYGSSYAVSAAQQAYQQQIGALTDAIPTLYRLALDTYTSTGDELVEGLDQLNAQEQSAQGLYNNELADYYTQLEQKGDAYNDAYAKDYGQYQDYLNQLDALYGYYSSQEQAEAARKQQTFNNLITFLGFLGDAAQMIFTGTVGLGSMAGSLLNTGYNIYANNRSYEAERADTEWSQQMQEKQYESAQNQQQYKNDMAEREYQDTLRQQQFNNDVTASKLNIAKGEWALKQSKANQKAAQATANAAAKASAADKSTGGSTAVGTAGSAGSANLGGSRSGLAGVDASSSVTVPYTAARLRSQGRSDSAIRNALLKEGYSSGEIVAILKQLNS